MRIKKIKSEGLFIYPATIAAAVKDANFLKENSIPMTLGEVNLYLNLSIPTKISELTNDSEYVTKTYLNEVLGIINNQLESIIQD